ncbi:MAG: hypothetical protein OJF50_002438 [Nitrospira sp.]|jgi:hypothetical protein|nr:hypothetical protein [Nitrospira sp.]
MRIDWEVVLAVLTVVGLLTLLGLVMLLPFRVTVH